MVYTEKRKINGRSYFYRVLSVRKGNKVSKKRVYLGIELDKTELIKKEKEADKKLLEGKRKKINREIEKIKSVIIKILKKNHVKRAGIFGSFVRGEQKKDSDIDILIEVDPIRSKKVSLIDIIRLQQFIEEKTGRKIDLVEYSELHDSLRKRVLKEEVKII